METLKASKKKVSGWAASKVKVTTAILSNIGSYNITSTTVWKSCHKYKHQADREIPASMKTGDADTEDCIWTSASAKSHKACCCFTIFNPREMLYSSPQVRFHEGLRTSWRYIEVKEPRDYKGKYHTSKQKIKKPVTLPEVSSLYWVHSCRCGCGCCIICLIPLLRQLNIICTCNILCNWSTDLTRPGIIY